MSVCTYMVWGTQEADELMSKSMCKKKQRNFRNFHAFDPIRGVTLVNSVSSWLRTCAPQLCIAELVKLFLLTSCLLAVFFFETYFWHGKNGQSQQLLVDKLGQGEPFSCTTGPLEACLSCKGLEDRAKETLQLSNSEDGVFQLEYFDRDFKSSINHDQMLWSGFEVSFTIQLFFFEASSQLKDSCANRSLWEIISIVQRCSKMKCMISRELCISVVSGQWLPTVQSRLQTGGWCLSDIHLQLEQSQHRSVQIVYELKMDCLTDFAHERSWQFASIDCNNL